MPETSKQYIIGQITQIDDEPWLVVRFVESTTLFEDSTNGSFTDHETYIELRNKAGEARFINLTSDRQPAPRQPGPIKGVKPYFWKVQNGNSPIGTEGDS